MYHQSIATIPIYQMQKISEGDLRYIQVFEKKADMYMLDGKEVTQEHKEAYKKLLISLKELDSTNLILISEMLRFEIIYLAEKSQSNNIKRNKAFWAYFEYLEGNYKNFSFKGKKIANLREFYQLKKSESEGDFFSKRIPIFIGLDYDLSGSTINEMVVILRKNNYPINIFEDTYQYLLDCLRDLKHVKNSK
jgi:hypothetical protein